MKHNNPPSYYEKIVNRFSPEALKAFEIFGCTEENATFPCLPVDRNRIIFVTCREEYKDKIRTSIFHPESNLTPYGKFYQGDNKVQMRCPLDCAVRGSAHDGGKRYALIRARTKHIVLRKPVTEIWPIFTDRILNWIRNIVL